MTPRRIAFINEKGGSGKTTLVANIACHLAHGRGHRVLAIDMDPQGQLGKVLGLEVRKPAHSAVELLIDSLIGEAKANADGTDSSENRAPVKLPLVSSRIPNLDVIVSNKSLALFPAWTGLGGTVTAERDPTANLSRAFARAPELSRYDYVLIDSPPSFGPLTLNILRACDEVVVPVPLTFLALDGFAELTRTLALVRSRYGNTDLRLTMVIPTFYRRTKLADEILQQLNTRFPKEVSHTTVGYHVKIDEAQSRGLSIFEYAKRDKGAETMAALAEELEARGAQRTEPNPPRPDTTGNGVES